MPYLILLMLLGGGAIAAGVAATRNNVPAGAKAKMQELFAKYCTKGANGEWAFRPDIAEAIMRTLSSQVYHYLGKGNDPSIVQVSADPNGVPPNPDLSALSWANAQNAAHTIMAPVYMAEAVANSRFLRAIAPGKENWDEGNLYAVLAYPGAIASGHVPGGPPAPGTTPPPVLVPTPVGVATSQIPPELQRLYTTLLHSGVDVQKMMAVAAQLDALGYHDAAELLRKRAADVGALPQGPAAPGTPPPTVVIPGPATVPPGPGPVMPPPGVHDAPPSALARAAMNMNNALASHGYKQADMPLYRAFQTAAHLTADGYPGRGTMGRLGAVLQGLGISEAAVQVYPWASKPGLSGYDGVNAPTVEEWTGHAAPAPAPAPSTFPSLGIPAFPGASASPFPSPSIPYPSAGPSIALGQPTALAAAMANALNAHGYRLIDQPLYKAFQASVGIAPDGYPGKGTMDHLAAALSIASIPMPNVPIYPWHNAPGHSGYDGHNAPTWAQWTQLSGAAA